VVWRSDGDTRAAEVTVPVKLPDSARIERQIRAAVSGVQDVVVNQLSARARTTGYQVRNKARYRAWNASLALAILLVALPMLVVITLALVVTQGSPFYRGVRLGKDRRTFQIYKFRTLEAAAATMTADRVLPSDAPLTTPLGGFLRDVRLDELPQLVNVIKGDMNIYGPRPVRPAIASLCEDEIPHYGERFRIRPGMIAQPQVFMSHGTPKRIRSAYHRILMRRPASIPSELALIAITVLSLFGRLGRKLVRRTRRLVAGRAASMPACPAGAKVTFGNLAGEQHAARLIRITDHYLYFECPIVLDEESTMNARISCRIRGGAKWRHARVAGQLKRLRRDATAGPPLYTMRFDPQSGYSRHIVLTYFLRRVVA
jgi:lipopolysaccharide/colanic/teichoic acid biosynthesis glycosyltransferase